MTETHQVGCLQSRALMETTAHLPLPTRCDVLVVGAGPAGSACAQLLAQAGLDVLLVDQHDFPRDKICGDGLIPDSHAALKRLGVFEEVAALAQPVQYVRCVGPRGGMVDVPGSLSVLPRKVLDHVLVRSAQRAGAKLLTPLRFEAPLVEAGPSGDRVVGARLKRAGELHDIQARWVVLATGAVPQAAVAAGLCERHTPSGIALRGYVKNDAMVERITQLQIVWHPKLKGGYGWIFPEPGGVFNIGAGLTGSHVETRGKGKMQNVNLREMFQAFQDIYAPARDLMATGTLMGDIKGAPLRCSMIGAKWSRPGLLGTGEVVGSTYAFTGEGIGKAMETGMLAAEALLANRQAGAFDADSSIQARYEATLAALKPRFDLYERASYVNHMPWIADLVVWRARKSPRILARMSGMLEETQNPGRLFTWRGLRKLMFE
jgi:geranylgeranyl reductase family protein